jgi:hypothetical protein
VLHRESHSVWLAVFSTISHLETLSLTVLKSITRRTPLVKRLETMELDTMMRSHGLIDNVVVFFDFRKMAEKFDKKHRRL